MIEDLQDFFLSCNDCVLENPRSFYGSFSLGPFKNSQSLTVANALRRTLLAEISSIAITQIEIDNVSHEYSTLEGVRESVLDMLLNFKQIVLKQSVPITKSLNGYLNVRGPGIIRASDFKLPPVIQCVDPDQYIATLNENGKLSLKFRISDYRNSLKNQALYEKFLNSSEFQNISNNLEFFENFKKQQTLLKLNQSSKQKDLKYERFLKKKTRSLWVDPIFNPILKVNYVIETIEPVQKNIPNQIIRIELWTNGSVHPRKAFYQALFYLKNMFGKLDTMRFLNYQNANKILSSEQTISKIFQNFEYDYEFYTFLEKKKLGLSSVQTLLKQEEIEHIQKEYFSELTDQMKETYNLLSIQRLNLPYRISNYLLKNNILTIGDLLKFNTKELKELYGMNNFSIHLIQQKLKKLGFILNFEKN